MRLSLVDPTIELTPVQWQHVLYNRGDNIMDPDGWDRRGGFFDTDWAKRLRLDEYITRERESTTMGLAIPFTAEQLQQRAFQFFLFA